MASIDKRFLKQTEEVTDQVKDSEENILGQLSELRRDLTDVEGKVSTLFNKINKIERDISEIGAMKQRLVHLED